MSKITLRILSIPFTLLIAFSVADFDDRVKKNRQLQYQKIEDTIISQIRNGELKQGDRLPSENELCEQFHVSRMTVNKALTHLFDQEYIERIPGRGSFVRGPRIERKIPEMLSFSEEHRRAGIETQARLLHYSVITAREKPEIRDHLHLNDEDFIHYFIRLRTGDGKTLAVSYNYIAVRKIPFLDVNYLEKSLYQYLEEKIGLQLAYNDTTIRVVTPSREIREYLQLSDRHDVVLSTHISYLSDNTPFEYTETYYNAEKYSFRYQCYRPQK